MLTKLFNKTRSLLGRLRKDRKGATMAEYSIMLAGVALLSLVAVSVLGHKVADLFSATAAILPGAHADDNGALVSGRLVETVNTGGTVTLDTAAVAAGGTRLGDNLGIDLTGLVLEP
ncbi:MAG: hypothetical protein L0Z62_01125 [Gemmataceae bacterium]|nr:hypothetical protein [Gemmataceae bacterium]